jgi:enoyl-CoA hydratase/carnithine racemase
MTMNDFHTIRFSVDNHVATLTLDNPSKRNALDPAMRVEVAEVVSHIRRDPSIRALILTGANGHFCSGGDLKNIATVGLDNQGWRQRLQDLTCGCKTCSRSIVLSSRPWMARRPVRGSAWPWRLTSCWPPRAPSFACRS